MRIPAFFFFVTVAPLAAGPDGAALYQQHCAMCHGQEGLGMPGVFPPLAKADFLVKEREKALTGPMEGLSGKITVNGQEYNGAMPPAFLDDEQLSAVFNHVFTSWGNVVKQTSAEEITAVRAKSKFPTLSALKQSMVGEKLPDPPAGWKLTVGGELSFSPSRLALHPDGRQVVVLSTRGDIWLWEPGATELAPLFRNETYIDPNLGDQLVMGMTVDTKGRLYIASNQCNKKASPVRNEMTIFRTEPWTSAKGWAAPKPWFKVQAPFGIGPYNHGLSHLAQGPDGFLYVNSGARTDSGEAGTQPNYATTGEDPITAVIWRMDPEAEKPEIGILASGLRNNYGFCWDDDGHMIATENGPDAHAPEELNLIEKGRHYGFPYQFSDWKEKAYPHTAEVPQGLEITLPFRNKGPHGGSGLSSFDPHSCPSGIVWLGKDWPAPFSGSFLTARFGNLLKLEGGDVGFDVLQLHVDFNDRSFTSKQILSPLGRPVDILKLPGHRLLIAEYNRATTLAAGMGTPGRLLLLEPEK
ncbi:MAG: c-type cytochrome [Verrucomicrobiaceae bacterium]|nr:MAG: c-type cytochrome [Verrucomicrobiaceae bacterium]